MIISELGKDAEFDALLHGSIGKKIPEGEVVKGLIVGEDSSNFIISVGLKSEGYVSKKEFNEAKDSGLSVGSEVNVLIERYEGRGGAIILSRSKANHRELWLELEKYFNEKKLIEGTIKTRIKGGFNVELSGGMQAFLPGSQIDSRSKGDLDYLVNKTQTFQILKMDKIRDNIVISRRFILEEDRAEKYDKLIEGMNKGLVFEGTVKNLTGYGAFVDLGGIDGLLHVTDISWKRTNHPSSVLSIDQKIKVKIIGFNNETKRVSLGMKQLESDPWVDIESRYQIGDKISGVITNIAEYGVFVELEDCIEGLVHVSEISWKKSNLPVSRVLNVGQNVEAIITNINQIKKRISLSMRRCTPNLWSDFANKNVLGTELDAEVKSIADFGLFVSLDGDLDGMIHISDLSWDKNNEELLKTYVIGDKIKCKLLNVDINKEKISLGIKQLQLDPFANICEELKVGQIVTTKILAIHHSGLDVKISGSDDNNSAKGFIKKADLSRDKYGQNTGNFAVDETVDAKVIGFDKKNSRVALSIRSLEIEEEKQVLSEYGSIDSGAMLGDILSDAFKDNKLSDQFDVKEEVVADDKAKEAKEKDSQNTDAKVKDEVEQDSKPVKS